MYFILHLYYKFLNFSCSFYLFYDIMFFIM
nr:MAG TPA: hypothetical protein [Bacteriophage sp.]